MSLSSLPVEILREIGYYIPKWPRLGVFQKDDVIAIHGLATSCNYLYRVFKPNLYQDINTATVDLFLLARSLKEDSSLITLVKTLSISRAWTCNFDAGKAYTLVKKLAVLPKPCKRHLHPADTEKIKLLLLESLLIVLRQVKKLSINLESINGSSEFFDSKRWKASPSNLLPNLEELEIVIHERPDYRPKLLNLTQVETILACPRKLYVEFPRTFLTAHDQMYLPWLHSLDIMCEAMTAPNFERLIRSCPNLRTFSIYGKSEPSIFVDDWGRPQVYLSLARLVEILSAEQLDLQTLSIHLTQNEESDWFIDERDTLPDFHVFANLRHLDLEFTYLWNFEDNEAEATDTGDEQDDLQYSKIEFLDKLPRSLEVLRIFCADDRGLKEFNALAERKHTDFPRLRRLELEMYDEYINGPDPPTPQLKKLSVNLASVGIDMTLDPGFSMT